jgi:hypothetical protein
VIGVSGPVDESGQNVDRFVLVLVLVMMGVLVFNGEAGISPEGEARS